MQIWPVPLGHKVSIKRESQGSSVTVELAHLIAAGFLVAGQKLHYRRRKDAGRTAQVLSDGRTEIEGQMFYTR
jgi:hypothetical protein